MILMLIFVGGFLLVTCFGILMWWLCGGNKLEKRRVAATKLHARAMAEFTEALNDQTEALRQATDAEKLVTAAWEREAKAAEKIAGEMRAMNEDELTEFFGKVFHSKKNPRGRHTTAPPENQNFDRN